MRCSIPVLATTILLTSSVTALPQQGEVELNDLFARQVQCNGGQICGYYQTLCCVSGGCYTDVNNQAQCKTYLNAATTTAVTSTYSTSIAGITPAAVPVAICTTALGQQSCANICCANDQFCAGTAGGYGTCTALPAGSTGYVVSYNSYATVTTDSAGVPLRPTGNTFTTVTQTSTIATGTTEPFQTPIATGANVTITTAQASSSGGLSGGAIAGIVIGVLLGLFILGLICFYCCIKGLIDGCLALFGLGRRRERKEVDIYERRTHHSSGGAGGAGGRTWYGAARPARAEDRRRSETKTVLGIGAALAALWAILGLKRRNQRRNEEKQSEYSYSYDSEYYTSESSASSDRRTRDDRRSRR